MAMGATTYEWALEHDKLLENPDKWHAPLRRHPVLGVHPPRAAGEAVRRPPVRSGRRASDRQRDDGFGRRQEHLTRRRDEFVGGLPDEGLLDEIQLRVADRGRRWRSAAPPSDHVSSPDANERRDCR